MDYQNIEQILQDLKPEERDIFDKIQLKISQELEKSKESRFDHLEKDHQNGLEFAEKHPDVIHPNHITTSPHEILITVTAEVSSIDDNGYLGEVKDLMQQYYHIPVKSGEDYVLFLKKFLEQFQQTLESTCRDSIV